MMIRFDEVPIKRDFRASDGDTYTKLINFKRWELGEEEEYNSIGHTGLLELFSDRDMVEIVDKCANCRSFADNLCESLYININDKWAERFWCSEFEKEK